MTTEIEHMAAGIGKAYAFFDSPASDSDIKADLPATRVALDIPGELELLLRDVKDFETDPQSDPRLVKIIRDNNIFAMYPSKLRHLMAEAKPKTIADLKYVLEARCPNMSNEETAYYLDVAVGGIYWTFGQEAPFFKEVIAEIDGEYLPRD